MAETPDISKLQDQVFELVRRSQEAILDAGRSFADNLASVAPGDREAIDKLLDDAFEFTERVLKTQRELAKSVVQAVTGPLTGGASGPEREAGDSGGDSGE
ncbi:hypothetical protein [Rhabdothermincola sp.]|uniref:hypothetical protein n=1 Tax=Rhabdothermincola sp. TaxID=2820405 RepID=UPI002FDF7025